jgi:uracil-DNA glycosylase
LGKIVIEQKNKTKKVIISLGSSILNDYRQIESSRNKKLKYKNIDLMFTYHPKDLITNEKLKRDTWSDFKYLRDNYIYG